MKKFNKNKKKQMKEKDGFGWWDEFEEKQEERDGIYGDRWKIEWKSMILGENEWK